MRHRRHARRVQGLLPRAGRALADAALRTLRHPQTLVVVGLLAVAGWALWSTVQRADAFRIARVELPPQSSLELRQPLVGLNLWELDLRALAGSLRQQQPWLKDVRVVRELPNAIHIDAIPRVPIAQVRLDRWYAVDREGFILPDGQAEPSEGLIRVAGLDRNGPALRTGKENASGRLQLGLRIVQALRHAPPSVSRRIVEVNVADPNAIRFLLEGGETEVRCGSETELSGQLARLRAALKAVSRQPLDVRYIDVRFKEPVIGPRT